jgi:NADH-quinone oxidoreductase subunit E
MCVADTMTVDLSLMDKIFERYEGQQGSLIPILQKAQDVYNYLPPDVLQRVSTQLGIPMSKIYGVATFYSQFYLEPRGKHILKVCDGTACHVKGTAALITAIDQKYGIQPGETTADGELTMEIVYCVGSCALAPVAVLDDQVMGHSRPDKFVRRVEKNMSAAQVTQEP